jgi:S-methylmethionine-dependent homocysteine/selenocysteine methylase
VRYRQALPQLDGQLLATDGGMETTLLFHDGFELPCFASFPLLDSDDGRAALARYYEPYLALARDRGIGFVLEAATWRASPGWGRKLGYSLDTLADANRRAIAFVEVIRDREEEPGRPFPISAAVGPEGDAYDPETHLSVDEAEQYHAWQTGILADTAADVVTALTLTYVEEAVGIARAATAAGLPVAISFTVETDGRLPSGQPLAEAVEQVDADDASSVSYFMVNCAHPTHVLPVLEADGPWDRVRGVRANASARSHAELDEAEELDQGDPDDFGRLHRTLRDRLPNVTVVGGCCGTDHRHVSGAVDAWLGA